MKPTTAFSASPSMCAAALYPAIVEISDPPKTKIGSLARGSPLLPPTISDLSHFAVSVTRFRTWVNFRFPPRTVARHVLFRAVSRAELASIRFPARVSRQHTTDCELIGSEAAFREVLWGSVCDDG